MNNLENIIRNTSDSNTKYELCKIYKYMNDNSNNNDINFDKISNKNYNQNPNNWNKNNVNKFLNEDNKKNVTYNISPKIQGQNSNKGIKQTMSPQKNNNNPVVNERLKNKNYINKFINTNK